MSWFEKLLRSGVTEVADGIAHVADRFIETPDERTAFKLQVKSLVERMLFIDMLDWSYAYAQQLGIVAVSACDHWYCLLCIIIRFLLVEHSNVNLFLQVISPAV